MAMALPLPGLGRRKPLPERQLIGRTASAPPDILRMRKILRPLNSEEVITIKENAKLAWQSDLDCNKRSVTTYEAYHILKRLDEPTQEYCRPSSQHRRNKPHPPIIFLTTHLKHLPGYYAPSEVLSTKYEGNIKHRLVQCIVKHKHGTLSNSALQRPNTSVGYERNPSQLTCCDKTTKKQTISRAKAKLQGTESPIRTYPTLRSKYSQTSPVTYSATRWLRRAGKAERDMVRDAMEKVKQVSTHQSNEGHHYHITDYSSMLDI